MQIVVDAIIHHLPFKPRKDLQGVEALPAWQAGKKTHNREKDASSWLAVLLIVWTKLPTTVAMGKCLASWLAIFLPVCRGASLAPVGFTLCLCDFLPTHQNICGGDCSGSLPESARNRPWGVVGPLINMSSRHLRQDVDREDDVDLGCWSRSCSRWASPSHSAVKISSHLDPQPAELKLNSS
jgi:hypothetical protein